jgi:DNA-binding GntR family transcriptional regulator
MDNIEEIEEEIAALEASMDNLTDEEIAEIEDKLEELQKQLEDEWFIKKHGLYAYYGVSERDFL